MIFYDTTKAATAAHRSGLVRMSTRLGEALGAAAVPVRWPEWGGRGATRDDWFLTAELFAMEDRPGYAEFLAAPPCRTAAVFYDAIPLKLPHIVWPQSVARHPAYLKQLARYDRVLAISETSRAELTGYWRWLGLERTPPVDAITLGADFDDTARIAVVSRAVEPPALLCVGILEPRKNQHFLLEVCETLWAEGLEFTLHLVGRVNPHFGKPVVARIRTLARRGRSVRWHEAADDATLARLYTEVRATAFPTMAEGCGLPVLESLWRGVPCVCSDLPVLREHATGGGCVFAAMGDPAAWQAALRAILTDADQHAKLSHEAVTRALPTWADTAQQVRAALGAA